MEVLLMAIFSLSNIACFLIGARVGQKVVKGETIEVPTVNPMKAYQEHKAKKEAEMEKSKIETILRNIDNYDGTPYGQEDV
jgi:queuine/archaeosine tRNA-ribosyltransferase